jgi:hypothetical protein
MPQPQISIDPQTPCCDRPSISMDIDEEAFGENTAGGGFRAEETVTCISVECHNCGWTFKEVTKTDHRRKP